MASSVEAPLLAPSQQEILLSRSQYHDASKENQMSSSSPSSLPPQRQLPTNQPMKDNAQIQSTSCESQNHHKGAKSWQAPVVMLLSLVSAMTLAILHDTMNRRLDGNIVDPDGPWSQKWTSRYGTALAFLIKMLFVTCVGTAFIQKQWLELSTHQQTLRIRNVDVLSNALSTPFSLVSSLIWLRNPLLLMIAMTCWTLPFAAVITPGTLSTESLPHINSITRTALQFSSNDELKNCDGTLYYGSPNPRDPSNSDYSNFSTVGMSERLHNLAYRSMDSSQIIPMKPAVANETFVANFIGPALNCTANTNITIAPLQAFPQGFDYFAWIGDSGADTRDEGFEVYFLTQIGDALPVYNPEFWVPYEHNQSERSNILWIIQTANRSASLFECQLWNATYDVEFVYQNFEQNVVRHNLTYQNPITSIRTPNEDHYREAIILNCFPKTILAALVSFVGNTYFFDQHHNESLANPGFTSSFSFFNITSLTPAEVCETIEELFWNITLSLFSVPEYLTKSTDNVSENITNWSNTYVYEQRDLLLAYGLSSLASLICCILGFHSFLKNGGSFQNNFSTYIRAAEGSDLNLRDFVLTGDTGADPLPMRLGEKTITMASRQRY